MGKIFFASDNCAKVHDKIFKSMNDINKSDDYSYGDDKLTKETKELIKSQFKQDADVHFVYNGTAANVISMKAALRSYEALITSDCSHIHDDETGAFENFVGSKIYPLRSYDGKIKLDDIKKVLKINGSIHQNQPRAISIAQSTETGTCYTTKEIKKICKFAHSNELYVHVDGARIANACVYLKEDLKSMIVDTNVDILSLGGTKNGGMFGEVIVVFNNELKRHVKYTIKQGLNLHSKQRYIASQYKTLFESELFFENAKKANFLAQKLKKEFMEIGIEIIYPVESNALFVKLGDTLYNKIKDKYFFHSWNGDGIYRIMTSFDTKESDVNEFIADIKRKL